MINTSQTGSSACQAATTLTPGRAKSHRASWAYLLTGSAPSTTTCFGHWHIPSGGTGAGGSADAWALTRQTTMDLGQLTETHRPRGVGPRDGERFRVLVKPSSRGPGRSLGCSSPSC